MSAGTDEERGITRKLLTIPQTTYDEVCAVAAERETTVSELIRKYIRFGIWVLQKQEANPSLEIIKRDQDGNETLILIL